MTTCSNYGSLSTGSPGSCSCPAGTGGKDCSSLTCGTALLSQSARAIFNATLAGNGGSLGCNSQCAAGWSGIDCNVCQSDASCGAGNICSSGPNTWTQSFINCDVVNPTLQAVFTGTTTLTIGKTVNTTLSLSPTISADNTTTARIYYARNSAASIAEQFYCAANSCVQSNSTSTVGEVDWVCQNLACTCIPGTQFCGGGVLDLTTTINTLSGELSISCTGQVCNFKTAVLVGLFGSGGLGLSNCRSGECVSPTAIRVLSDLLTPTIVTAPRLAPGVIGGLAVLGAVVFAIAVLVVLGCLSQRKARRRSIDSFEKDGSADAVGVRWSNLGYTLPASKGSSGRVLLDGLSGEIQSGQLLAILGTTGAGKSTFVELLAGKRKVGVTRGSIELFSNHGLDAKATIGFVDQEDVLSGTSTCREALMFAADLKLSENVSLQIKRDRVQAILVQLGLERVSESRIGDREVRGLSGGERRRLSIGLELIARPAIFMCDEPTSGLDAASANRVMQALRELANQGTTVITTIHQPSSRIYSLFDSVLVLALGGRQVYYGDAKLAMATLAERGYPCPDGFNPADHLLEVASDISIGHTSSTGSPPPVSVTLDTTQRPALDGVQSFTKRSAGSVDVTDSPVELLSYPVNGITTQSKQCATTLLTQFEVLAGREIKILQRDLGLIVMHNAVAVIVGLFVGGIYYKIGDTIGGFQSRVGSLFFLGSLLAFSSLSALSNFSSVKILFLRERAGAFYSPFAWFLSRVLFDIVPLRVLPTIVLGSIVYWMVGLAPEASRFFKFLLILVEFNVATTLWNLFLAAAIQDAGVAILISAVTNLVFMAYAGFFVSIANIPAVLRWLQWLDPLKYMLEALSINEVDSGLMITDVLAGVPVSVSAQLILETLFGFDSTAFYRDVLVLFGFIAGLAIMVCSTVYWKLREMR